MKLGFHGAFIVSFANTISITAISFSLILCICISIVNKEINQSITYRISILIATGDLLYNIGGLIKLLPIVYTNSHLCYFSQSANTFGFSISVYYSIVIAILYLLNIVYEYKVRKVIKYIIYIVPFILSILSCILPIIFKKIDTDNECSYYDDLDGDLWLAFCNSISMVIAIIVIPVIYIIIANFFVRKTMRKKSNLSSSAQKQSNHSALSRLLSYSLLPIITHSLMIFLVFFVLSEKMIDNTIFKILKISSVFLIGLQGLLNSILLLTNSILIKELNNAYDKIFGLKELDDPYRIGRFCKI